MLLSILIPGKVLAQTNSPFYVLDGYWWLDDDRTSQNAEDNSGFGLNDILQNTDISGVEKNSPIVLRVDVSETSSTVNTDDLNLQLEYKVGTTNCTDTGWASVTTSTSNDWALDDTNTNITDGAPTSADRILTNTSPFAVGQPGSLHKSTNPDSAAILDSSSNEWEWIIYATDSAVDEQTYTFRVTNNGTPLDDYGLTNCPRAVTAPAQTTTFTQTDYRWYVDNGAADPTDPWSAINNVNLAENTAIAYPPTQNDPPGPEQELRLRINLTVNSVPLAAENELYKLQFKQGLDGSCTYGSWQDVSINSDWEYSSGSIVQNGASINKLLTTTTVGKADKYVNDHPINNGVTANIGDRVEYDFHIVGTNAGSNTQYSFRVVQTDITGTEEILLDNYENCPTLTTEPQATDFMRHGKILNETNPSGGFFWAD